ncbi:TetR/AcrR family transcriptional regulator [Ideonella sp.]|uniref:TetR/AcrR family transcriptional regulator n=1 Tax=Ideonella sp. TaxID=1929293 RepID=UPI002B462145|nr:TetR/AcrR family transcriptional regulator [Ideonella sp.]HJV71664.1 TetR/AcrR family transcriptional regulator [Ideonella sp.]
MPSKTAAPRPADSLPRVRRGNAGDAQLMREVLTDAALALFSEGGPNAVSMRGLSARLGISAMTPYRYFANKAALFGALWQHLFADLHAAVSRAVDSHTGGRNRFRACVDAFLAYYESHPDEYRLVYLTPHGTGVAEPEQISMFGEFKRLIRLGVAEFAQEIGVAPTHGPIAEDLTLLTVFGYLQAAMVHHGHPWSDRGLLRSACIGQMVLMVERCLRDGPHDN